MNKPLLSVIVPCYNEETRITKTLDALLSFLPRYSAWEIVAVDDGSTDATPSILGTYQQTFSHFSALRCPHKGKGKAVRAGMLFASGTFRLFMDADLSTPLKETERALAEIAHHDIVIGSRELDRGKVRATWKRRIMGRIFHAIISDLVPDVRDTQCGFKLFRESAALDLFNLQRLDGFAFDVELLYLARLRGYAVKEMPVTWTHAEGSKVQAVRHSLEMLRDVMEIPYSHHTIAYTSHSTR
jgi:dolichyl-phosphate beta-glucosyltransferase